MHRKNYELIFKYNVGLKTLLREAFRNQNLMEAWFTKLKKVIERNNFFSLEKISIGHKRIVYKINVMRQSVCFVLTESRLITICLLELHAGGSGVRL